MAEKTLFIGVDVSKDHLDIAFVPGKEEAPIDLGKFTNKKSGFSSATQKFQKIVNETQSDNFEIIVEPTGGYEKLFVQFCMDQSLNVKVVIPYRVRQWAKSQGTRGKTDAIDARVLALYGANHDLPQWTFLPEEIKHFEDLLQRIDQVEEHLQQEKNRRHALQAKGEHSTSSAKSVDRMISLLEKELVKLRKEIDKHLKDHPHLQEELKIIKGIPGIGDKNSLSILSFLYQFHTKTSGQGTAKEITAFAGLDPTLWQSGNTVFKRPVISRQGSPKIRKVLYLAVRGGLRNKNPDNPLKLFVERLKGRGKKHKLAMVAAARKLLIWAWTIFKTGTPFEFHKAAMTTS